MQIYKFSIFRSHDLEKVNLPLSQKPISIERNGVYSRHLHLVTACRITNFEILDFESQVNLLLSQKLQETVKWSELMTLEGFLHAKLQILKVLILR